MTHASEIAIFAERFNIPFNVAYTLPAIFEKAAKIGSMPVRALISRATYDNELGEYIKSVAIDVAQADGIADRYI